LPLFKMNEEELLDVVTKSKKTGTLRITLLVFLIKWYFAVGKKDKEFGFREAQGLDQQLEMAVEFLQKTEREWQDRVRENKTSLTFPLYFEYKARAEDIALPTDFQDKIGGKDEF